MYTSIIVGYDESLSSKAALKEASWWAKKHNGKVTLVHAVYFDQEEFAILPSQLEQRMEIGTRACKLAKAEILTEYGLNGSVESLVCEGEPHDVLVDTAQGKNADLIALGTYGRRGLKRLLMGSVTSQVIQDAPCDVLVVKRPCEACTGNYGSILVPFDGSEFGKKALSRAMAMAKQDGSAVTVLYVIPRYEEMLGFFKTESIRLSLRAEAEKVIAQAGNIAKKEGITIKTSIQEGHAADIIVKATGEQGADLIVMGSHGWRGVDRAIMGSTTGSVITHASVPVLVAK